jgi:hypothetical protein
MNVQIPDDLVDLVREWKDSGRAKSVFALCQ